MMVVLLKRDTAVIKNIAMVLGVAAISASAVVMLRLGWYRWPDVLVDFGRELYVPWALAQGKVLYRDVLYFSGPLAPYLNAAWFILFGASLHTLVGVNFTVVAATTGMVFLVLKRIASAAVALLACFVFVSLFAFGQYTGIGNYNYVCPYSHDVTYGMFLSWVALYGLMAYLEGRRTRWLVVAGVATGAVFLTKPEFFFALAAASVSALCLSCMQPRLAPFGSACAIKTLGVFTGGAFVPPLAAFLLLATRLNLSEAAVAIVGGWWYICHTAVSGLVFFRVGMGTENLAGNLGTMVTVTGMYAAILVPAALAAITFRRQCDAMIFSVVVVTALFVLGWVCWTDLPWLDAARPLPLALALVGAWHAVRLHRGRGEMHAAALVLIVFSFALLAKILLYARVHHYGFALAMPATLLLVVALFEWVPAVIERRGGQQGAFRVVALALMCVLIARYVCLSAENYARKTVIIGKGRDSFFADERGLFVNQVLEWLNRKAKADETLCVLPEGIMINYLARMSNPSPIVTTIPSDMLMFGEKRLLSLIRAAPPTHVVLVHRDDSEYGYGYFGSGYGRSIMSWLAEEYLPVQLIGDIPLRSDRFGILILRRRHIQESSGERSQDSVPSHGSRAQLGCTATAHGPSSP